MPQEQAAAAALPAGARPLGPGDPRAVGPYRLLGRLGSGGMGTVYLGQAPAAAGLPRSGRVAIKLIRPELAADQAFCDRFAQEAAAARRVAGFCTARVLDADVQARPPYLVTEFVDGVRLDQAVARDGPLAQSSLEGFAVGVAAALTAIHQAGVVHRDLKPANVLLSYFGPRVIDFGIARALDERDPRTGPGMLLGTPGWMAPEQFSGEPVGTAADIFVWGALVAFAATGRLPFGEGPVAALSYRIVHQPPDLDGLPESLRPVVAAAMDKDPRSRPSAKALLLRLLGDRAAEDSQAAVTQVLRNTWAPPPAAAPTRPPVPSRGVPVAPAAPGPPPPPPASPAAPPAARPPAARGPRLLPTLGRELADPWGLLLGATAGGVAWAIKVGTSPAQVGAVAVAVWASKALAASVHRRRAGRR